MYYFQENVGSKARHVYNDRMETDTCKPITVSKELNATSMQHDLYCCRITIQSRDKFGTVTVRHIPRELSRFAFFFLKVGGAV